MRQDARAARLVTQLQTRTPPSTFCWSIHRWKDSSPLSVLSAMHLRASPSIREIRDLADRFGSLDPWSCKFRVSGWGTSTGAEEGTSRSTSSRTQETNLVTDQQQAARTATRLLSFNFTQFICPYTLSLACSVSAFCLTSTSPTRHAPRRSRDLPRDTPSQASNDVQCHTSEGHSGDVQKVYG